MFDEKSAYIAGALRLFRFRTVAPAAQLPIGTDVRHAPQLHASQKKEIG